MKRDKILMLVGIFLVAIILSTIHQGYREGMSHHDKKENLKGEEHAANLIETDINHKQQTMQDSNHYSHNKHHDKWNNGHDLNGDDSEDDGGDDEDDSIGEENIYGPGGEENIYGPGGEEWPPHHHKHHHKHHKPSNHNKHHNKHHHKPHHNEESMNTMNDDSMYVLKSEVVPPICPACPQTTACPKKKPCPPCPPCARCPDNNFECKKVPNYEGGDSSLFPANMFGPELTTSSSNEDDGSAPQPYLNSFAQF